MPLMTIAITAAIKNRLPLKLIVLTLAFLLLRLRAVALALRVLRLRAVALALRVGFAKKFFIVVERRLLQRPDTRIALIFRRNKRLNCYGIRELLLRCVPDVSNCRCFRAPDYS